MAGGPVDPREILKGVEALLGKDGELRSLEGVPKVFRWAIEIWYDVFSCLHGSTFMFCDVLTCSLWLQPDESLNQDGQ